MNEPAFPVPMIALTQEGEHPEVRYSGQSGMTLRDYFAAAALPQVLSSMVVRFEDDQPARHYAANMRKAAKAAYQYADAMLAERAKTCP